MSVNYASGLSEYPNKGVCGLPEKFDSEEDVEMKSALLADWIKQAGGLVAVHTGAGISTASGIPDFRGPRGVWTLEQKNEKPTFDMSFESARPSVTHMALVALEEAGYISAVITQNVDGLHLRSGFPRNRLAILHGDMFLEECEFCHTLYQRSQPVTSVGLKRSGVRCKSARRHGRGQCRGYLRDTILDWEDELPAEDLDFAYKQSERALLSLCLGTSLRIVPGGELPLLTKKKNKKKGRSSDSAIDAELPPGRLSIVNLQVTKRDRDADLKIHSYVDKVMESVCNHLGIVIPRYTSPKLCLESRYTSPNEVRRWNLLPSEETCSLSPGVKRHIAEKDGSYIPETKFLRNSSPKAKWMKPESESSHDANLKPTTSSKEELIEIRTENNQLVDDCSEDSNKTKEMKQESDGSDDTAGEKLDTAANSSIIEKTEVLSEGGAVFTKSNDKTISSEKQTSEMEVSLMDTDCSVTVSDGCSPHLERLKDKQIPNDIDGNSSMKLHHMVCDVSKEKDFTEDR